MSTTNTEISTTAAEPSLIGSRDCFLLGVYPGIAVGPVLARRVLEEFAPSISIRDEQIDAIAEATAALDGRHEARGAPRAFAECAARNRIGVPEFEPSLDWVNSVRQALQRAMAAARARRPYELGLTAGEISCKLFALRTVSALRKAAPENPLLREHVRLLMKQIDAGRQQLRALGYDGTSDVGRILQAHPDFIVGTSSAVHRDWIRDAMRALGQLGLQFVNELPVAVAPPGEQERALFEQILRDPASDELRMQYEKIARRRNDPRAYLIELQMNARHMRRRGISLDYGDLLTEASKLIGAHPEWTDEVVAHGVGAAMHRGFVEEIKCDVSTFLEKIGVLVTIEPILHVTFREAAGRGAEIAACTQLAQLQSLSFEQNGITDSDIAAIAHSPYAGKLRWLNLGWNKITDAGVDALAAARLPSLVCVDLGSNPCRNPVDEQYYYTDDRYDYRTTDRGQELEAKYGPLRWLHPSVEVWPPPMGIV